MENLLIMFSLFSQFSSEYNLGTYWKASSSVNWREKKKQGANLDANLFLEIRNVLLVIT